MADHYFSTDDELRNFWNNGRGYLFNRFYKRLHKTSCPTYRNYALNAPSLANNRQGFDTPEDVLKTLGHQDDGWISCSWCNPHESIYPAFAPFIAEHEKKIAVQTSAETIRTLIQQDPTALSPWPINQLVGRILEDDFLHSLIQNKEVSKGKNIREYSLEELAYSVMCKTFGASSIMLRKTIANTLGLQDAPFPGRSVPDIVLRHKGKFHICELKSK